MKYCKPFTAPGRLWHLCSGTSELLTRHSEFFLPRHCAGTQTFRSSVLWQGTPSGMWCRMGQQLSYICTGVRSSHLERKSQMLSSDTLPAGRAMHAHVESPHPPSSEPELTAGIFPSSERLPMGKSPRHPRGRAALPAQPLGRDTEEQTLWERSGFTPASQSLPRF